MESTDRIRALEAGFQVGGYLAEPRLQRISGDGQEIRVEPRVMDVLERLAEQPGHTVTKEEFMEEVWRETVVTDDALLRCISELRKIFEDDPRAGFEFLSRMHQGGPDFRSRRFAALLRFCRVALQQQAFDRAP